jgi:hypothetical protein
VDRWGRSGETCVAFASAHGLNPSTLSWWRWKLSLSTSPFLEVVVVEPEPVPDFEVAVGDVRVRVPLGFDAAELRRLVAALC